MFAAPRLQVVNDTENAPIDAAGEAADADRPELWIVAIAEHRDRVAFISLFRRFAPKVKGYLMRQRLSEAQAEEIAQETLLMVWRKAAQYDPLRSNAAAWIFTIARNLHTDVVRRERHPDAWRMIEGGSEPSTPEEQLKTREGESRVRSAIHGLAPEQALVLMMSFFQEMTHEQISARLRVPLGTVKSRIRLAAAHLRVALDDLA